MADAIDTLIEKHYSTIDALQTGYGVYSKIVPSTESGDAYIFIGAITGNNEAGKNMQIERYNVTISIFCQNASINVDSLAATIKAAIVNDKRQSLIDFTPFKAKIIDYTHNSPEGLLFPDANFINRHMTFTYLIH